MLTFNANVAGLEVKESSYLKPWGIYLVKFKGIQYTKLVSKKDGKEYESAQVTFEHTDDEGNVKHYVHNYFGPNGDLEKFITPYEGENSNGKYKLPSPFDIFRNDVNHIVSALATKAGKKDFAQKFANMFAGKSLSFENYVKIIEKHTQEFVDKYDVYLKLIGNSSNFATIPQGLSYSKESGELFRTNNFLAASEEKLSFTTYELKKKEEIKNKKATAMPSISGSGSLEEDLNLETDTIDDLEL